MHQFLAIVAAIMAVSLLASTLRQARGAGRGKRPATARKDGFLAHRRRLREMREKDRLDGAREEARDERARQREAARDERARLREEDRDRRQREREQDRQDGQPQGDGPRRRGVPRVIRLKPEKADSDPGAPQAPGGGTREPSPAPPGTAAPPGSTRPPAPEPPRPPGPSGPPPQPPSPAPQPQSPPAPAPAPANGGTTPVTTPAVVGGIEDLITAIDRIRARAAAGNIQAKLAALRACQAACARFAQMAAQLARQMSDQGHYGPEITERASAAGIHLAAAASGFSDAANALKTLLDMRLGDVPRSGRQAPHHAELSETGAR